MRPAVAPRGEGLFIRAGAPGRPARSSGVTLASPLPSRRGCFVWNRPEVAGGGTEVAALRRAANSGGVGELPRELGGRSRER